jgi:hypothetical protein
MPVLQARRRLKRQGKLTVKVAKQQDVKQEATRM